MAPECLRIVLLKLTADRHEASRSLFATAELFVLHCVSKTVHFCFCQNIVIFPPILIIDGKVCEIFAMYTSPGPRCFTTLLNADVLNCYVVLKFFICNNLSELAHINSFSSE